MHLLAQPPHITSFFLLRAMYSGMSCPYAFRCIAPFLTSGITACMHACTMKNPALLLEHESKRKQEEMKISESARSKGFPPSGVGNSADVGGGEGQEK
jgi:hypothetical protein